MAVVFSKFKNFGRTTLAAAIDDDDLSFTVEAGTGDRLPSATDPESFQLALGSDDGGWEMVTARRAAASDTVTIVARAAEDGTEFPAKSHDAGVSVINAITGKYIDELQDAVNGMLGGTVVFDALKLDDDAVLRCGAGNDFGWGYDSALNAGVFVDSADNILAKVADLGASAYWVFEAPVMEVHRAVSATSNEVALRLGLNDTDDDALSAAEVRAQWTTNTLGAEVSRLSFYARNAGALAEQMRLGGDGDLTVYGNIVYLDCDEAATARFEVGGLAGQNREFRWSTSGSRRFAATVFGAESSANAGSGWFLQAYDDAGAFIDSPITVVRAANGIITFARRALIDTLTTAGDAALEIKQDDADEPFIKFTGTSAASSANNISTWTTGATLQGYVRVAVGGTDYWMPYYTAPTS